MYVYRLKIIKYCCIYLDIDKEYYVLKLARCLDYWFFDLVVTKTHQNPSLSFLFSIFFFPFFPFFYYFFCCCCCSFFSFFNWKEKLSFRAWKGSEIYRSNSRCSTISPLDGHALNRPFHVFFVVVVVVVVFFFVFFNFWHKRVRKNPSTPQQRKRLNK